MSDDNVRRFPVEKADRVIKLASAITQVLSLADADEPEDHLAALMLVQVAIQQAVSRERGIAELQRILIAANEKRRRYDAVHGYKPKEKPDV
jgi:hypothetical protein